MLKGVNAQNGMQPKAHFKTGDELREGVEGHMEGSEWPEWNRAKSILIYKLNFKEGGRVGDVGGWGRGCFQELLDNKTLRCFSVVFHQSVVFIFYCFVTPVYKPPDF